MEGVEVKSSVYKFQIDQFVYNVLSGERMMIRMLRTITDKGDNDKYYSYNQYYVYSAQRGFEWLDEKILTKELS